MEEGGFDWVGGREMGRYWSRGGRRGDDWLLTGRAFIRWVSEKKEPVGVASYT